MGFVEHDAVEILIYAIELQRVECFKNGIISVNSNLQFAIERPVRG